MLCTKKFLIINDGTKLEEAESRLAKLTSGKFVKSLKQCANKIRKGSQIVTLDESVVSG